MAKQADVSVEKVRDVTLVRFTEGSILDVEHIEQIAQQLYHLAKNPARKKIVLNFSEVQFMSSQALGVMVTFRKRVVNNQARAAVCSMRPELRQLFKITRLESLFPFFDTESEAILSFEKAEAEALPAPTPAAKPKLAPPAPVQVAAPPPRPVPAPTAQKPETKSDEKQGGFLSVRSNMAAAGCLLVLLLWTVMALLAAGGQVQDTPLKTFVDVWSAPAIVLAIVALVLKR